MEFTSDSTSLTRILYTGSQVSTTLRLDAKLESDFRHGVTVRRGVGDGGVDGGRDRHGYGAPETERTTDGRGAPGSQNPGTEEGVRIMD